MFGVINLHKPAGITSRQTLDYVTRQVHPFKAGHAGTLDPLATGVLVVCVGHATRLIERVQNYPKLYRAAFRMGCVSPSDDCDTEITELLDSSQPTRDELEQLLPRFTGEIAQTPPAFSAVKVNGRRAYKIARKGRAVVLEPRPVTVHYLRIAEYAYPRLVLEIECGSGTYVRALGRDLAAAAGTGAIMEELERSAIGPFTLDNAIDPQQLTKRRFSDALLPPQTLFPGFPRVTLTIAEQQRLIEGRELLNPAAVFSRATPVAAPNTTEQQWLGETSDGRLFALLGWDESRGLIPMMVFPPIQGKSAADAALPEKILSNFPPTSS